MNPSWLTYGTLLIPLLGMSFCLLLTKSKETQRYFSMFLSALYFIVSSLSFFVLEPSQYELISMGGWPLPKAISIGYTSLSLLFIWVSGLIYFIACLYAHFGKTCEDSAFFFPLIHTLFFGLSGAFLTHDLFNLYVWFEVTLISSFGLLCLKMDKKRIGGVIKYVVLSFFSSIVFLVAIGLIYAHTGTLDMQDLQVRLALVATQNTRLVDLLGILLFIAFAIKSALFPFYVWLPASYTHTSVALSGVFAGLLTKLGLYSIIRVINFTFPINDSLTSILLLLAPLTMIIGVFGAVIQKNIRKILVFHTISQIGYMAMACALMGHQDQTIRVMGLAAALFYIVQYIPIKTNLFFISGMIKNYFGSEELARLGELRKQTPLLATLFAITAAGLVGLPPSSGFWAKFSLVKATIHAGFFTAAAAMIFASFFTLYSMLKIWNEAFWAPAENAHPVSNIILKRSTAACVLLVIVNISIAIYPSLLMEKTTIKTLITRELK